MTHAVELLRCNWSARLPVQRLVQPHAELRGRLRAAVLLCPAQHPPLSVLTTHDSPILAAADDDDALSCSTLNTQCPHNSPSLAAAADDDDDPLSCSTPTTQCPHNSPSLAAAADDDDDDALSCSTPTTLSTHPALLLLLLMMMLCPAQHPPLSQLTQPCCCC